MARYLLCALLLAPALATAADPIGWRLEQGEYISYTAVAAEPRAGETKRALPYEQWVGFWYELNAKGDGWDVRQRAEISLALALMLPDRKLSEGQRAPLERRFEIAGMKQLLARGAWIHRGAARFADADAVKLELKVSFSEEGGKTSSYKLLESHFEAEVYVHPARGYVLGAVVDSRFKVELKSTKTYLYDEPYRFTLTVARVESVSSSTLDTRINKAIDDGVKGLLKKQKPTGEFGGMSSHPMGSTALALLALLKSGVAPDDPAIASGFAFLAPLANEQTYDVALKLMAIDARYAPAPAALHAIAPRARKKVYADAIARMPAAEKQQMVAAAKWLVDEGDKGRWWYPHTGDQYKGQTYYDNSNTQYAVLGLYAAERCGIATPLSTWIEITDHFLAAQEASGPEVIVTEKKGRYVRKRKASARGWNYQLATVATTSTNPTTAYGSMTAGAIATMAICREVLARKRKLDRGRATKTLKSIEDGLAWLQQYYGVRANPRNGSWNYYYLYALERAGIFTDTTHVGTHDWYREGAAVLVSWQNKEGLWKNSEYQSAFALLFLRKASVPMMTTGK